MSPQGWAASPGEEAEGGREEESEGGRWSPVAAWEEELWLDCCCCDDCCDEVCDDGPCCCCCC